MKFLTGFDKEKLIQICKKANSRQAVKDVGYAAFIAYRKAEQMYAERIDDIACIFGYYNAKDMRIICTAVDEQYKHKGYGSILVLRAMNEAKKAGCTKIKTRTYAGHDFYKTLGFVTVGMKHGDYLMEALL